MQFQFSYWWSLFWTRVRISWIFLCYVQRNYCIFTDIPIRISSVYIAEELDGPPHICSTKMLEVVFHP